VSADDGCTFSSGIDFECFHRNWRDVMVLLKRLSIGAAALLVIGAVSVVLAQTSGTGQQASPMYDVKTETMIKGTVESVETVAGMGARGRGAPGGTHLVVKTEKETITVHVGPTAYLAEKGITLAKGDSVEILGSRVTMGSEPVLIAKQIKKGDKAWMLRDASGRPLWSGRGR
jgi:hypothetical protein